MKYLGIEIIKDEISGTYLSLITHGTFLSLDNIKKEIRKKELPTYKPTKTLAWLEEKTGVEWLYNNEYNMLSIKGVEEGEVYDFKDNTAFLWLDGSIIINPYNEDGTWVEMTPREFIEKIEKGEWD